jgi:hypothetical protein
MRELGMTNEGSELIGEVYISKEVLEELKKAIPDKKERDEILGDFLHHLARDRK